MTGRAPQSGYSIRDDGGVPTGEKRPPVTRAAGRTRGNTSSPPFWLVIGGILLVLLLAGGHGPVAARVGTAGPPTATCSTGEYDGYTYKVCVPSGYSDSNPAPLVVMLHGCMQDYEEAEQVTEFTSYAEAQGFIVVYPDQPQSNNPEKCWNWFLPEHQARGAGEPAVIAGIVMEVAAQYTVDCGRIFVTGMSAGAAMSIILGATYPDLFAAVGATAGLEFRAASDAKSALLAQQSGGPDPEQQGVLAYEAMGEVARVVPVLVFHGSEDQTVREINAEQIISQWAQTNDLALDGFDNGDVDDIPDSVIDGMVEDGDRYTRYIYYDLSGRTMMEKYIVHGMSHEWSGGAPSSPYANPDGPEASAIMLDFFFAHPKSCPVEVTPTPTSTSIPEHSPTSTRVPSPTSTAQPSVTLTIPGATPSLTTTPSPSHTATMTSTATSEPSASPVLTVTPTSTTGQPLLYLPLLFGSGQ